MLNRISLAIMQDDNNKHSKWPDKIDGIIGLLDRRHALKSIVKLYSCINCSGIKRLNLGIRIAIY